MRCVTWPPWHRTGSPDPVSTALTRARSRALSLLHAEFPLPPNIFAHYMWPESKSWSRGHQPGRAIRAKASTFLARLEQDGLVARLCDETQLEHHGYVISQMGVEAIGGAEEALTELPTIRSDTSAQAP
jgi:hypothetical protein